MCLNIINDVLLALQSTKESDYFKHTKRMHMYLYACMLMFAYMRVIIFLITDLLLDLNEVNICGFQLVYTFIV